MCAFRSKATDYNVVSSSLMASSPSKPLALVVLLENVGHIAGLNLPQWSMNTIDFLTEEYAKIRLKQLGAYHHYDQVLILEDERATSVEMANTLIQMSQTHCIDQLLLVHGQKRSLVGYRGKAHIDDAMFDPLLAAYTKNPGLLDLRMVYGLNCYGASLAPVWLQLGARVVNGAVGVNWLPEPSLSLFLRAWFGGFSYSQAVVYSHYWALKVGKRIWPNQPDGSDHPRIAGSRQIIYGQRDITIH
jgi:hypothetical protein